MSDGIYGNQYEAQIYTWVHSWGCNLATVMFHIGHSQSLWISLGMSIHRLISSEASLAKSRDYRVKHVIKLWIAIGWWFYIGYWLIQINTAENKDNNNIWNLLCIGNNGFVIYISWGFNCFIMLTFSLVNIALYRQLEGKMRRLEPTQLVSKMTLIKLVDLIVFV